MRFLIVGVLSGLLCCAGCSKTPNSNEGQWVVVLYDVTTGTPKGVPLEHSTVVDHVALSDDGTRLATLGRKRIATQTLETAASTRAEREKVREEFRTGVLCIWDPSNGELIASNELPRIVLTHAEFVPNSTLVVTQGFSFLSGHESQFIVWDFGGGALVANARIEMEARPRKLIVASDSSSILILEPGIPEERQTSGTSRGPHKEPTNGKITRYGLDGSIVESVFIGHDCSFGAVSGDRKRIVLWGASHYPEKPVCRWFDLEKLCLIGESWQMSAEHRLAGMNDDGSRWITISRGSDPVSGRLVILDGETREAIGNIPGPLRAIQPIVVGDTVVALAQQSDTQRWHLHGWDMNGRPQWTSAPLFSNRFIVDGANSQNLLAFTHYPDDRHALKQTPSNEQ